MWAFLESRVSTVLGIVASVIGLIQTANLTDFGLSAPVSAKVAGVLMVVGTLLAALGHPIHKPKKG